MSSSIETGFTQDYALFIIILITLTINMLICNFILDESATAVTTTTSSSSSVILACEIPNNASVGQSFHVKSPDGRYFEVQVVS